MWRRVSWFAQKTHSVLTTGVTPAHLFSFMQAVRPHKFEWPTIQHAVVEWYALASKSHWVAPFMGQYAAPPSPLISLPGFR